MTVLDRPCEAGVVQQPAQEAQEAQEAHEDFHGLQDLTDAPVGRQQVVGDVSITRVGALMPAAVVDGRTGLRDEARDEITAMMGSDPVHFIRTLATTWLAIIVTIAAAMLIRSVWFDLFAIFFIATRQNMLGLLNHEQTHRLGVRSRLGDHLANMTMAWPLLITLEGYRRIHLAHHRHYFTDQDPDFRRKQGPEWTYPKRVMQFLTTVVVDVTGFNIVRFVAGKRGREAKSGPPKPITPPWARLVFYGAAAVTFTWTETWIPFLVYWVLPWATVLQLIVRWGAVCEHKYNLVSPSVEQSTPIIEPGRLESLLLPNLNFNLHIYHHWYPAIPFTKLPRVHEIFRREGLVRDENVFHGYISYLMYLLGRRPELS